jgi:hypothetical protein
MIDLVVCMTDPFDTSDSNDFTSASALPTFTFQGDVACDNLVELTDFDRRYFSIHQRQYIVSPYNADNMFSKLSSSIDHSRLGDREFNIELAV